MKQNISQLLLQKLTDPNLEDYKNPLNILAYTDTQTCKDPFGDNSIQPRHPSITSFAHDISRATFRIQS